MDAKTRQKPCSFQDWCVDLRFVEFCLESKFYNVTTVSVHEGCEWWSILDILRCFLSKHIIDYYWTQLPGHLWFNKIRQLLRGVH